MKKIFSTLVLILTIAFSIHAQQSEAGEEYQFEIVTENDATSVKNQQKTGTCWSFSTVSFLESELIRMGKGTIDLSEMYVVRKTYPLKAERFVRYHGKNNFSPGSLSHDVINCVHNFGMVPEAVYSGKKNPDDVHNHSEMHRMLNKMLEETIKSKTLSEEWKASFAAILDVYLGEDPEKFTYNDKEYTPRTFADEVLNINANDYVSLSSFLHHPFNEKFILEVPDNFCDGMFYNIPIEDLTKTVDFALENGFTIAWDCDVSDKGFSARKGIAIMPEKDWKEMTKEEAKLVFETPTKELEVTQEMRQAAFDDYTLTDDHLMHITGIVKDQNGTKYYIVKNSWGENISKKGYLYVSEAYFKMNTISILLHKDGIPKNINKQLGL